MTEPTRPVLRWHGGKWLLAPWIMSFFPQHRTYAEPFGGAASVLLRKRRVGAEVYNDLDGTVVNLFRVLRDPTSAAELAQRLRLTPYARSEFEFSYGDPVDPVDEAHRTIIRSFMGFSTDAVTRTCRTGFRAALSGNAFPAREWSDYYEQISIFTERLSGVLIEQTDAAKLIKRCDAADTLFFVDPPYVLATRSAMANGRASVHGYRHELTDDDHLALLEQLRGVAGMVVLSGYPHRIYEENLAGWDRHEREALADGARPRTEVVWLNPACAAALRAETPSLFDDIEGAA